MNEVGNVYGYLEVLSQEKSIKGTKYWLCKCHCGELRTVAGTHLRAGRNKSCGCMNPTFKSKTKINNPSDRKNRAYKIWMGMLHRCSSSANGKSAKLYYGKGISVCNEWYDFDNFYRDMGDTPISFSIDRIDGNSDYCKENCRWATSKEQANNTSQNVKLTMNGESLNISEWAERIGVKVNTLIYRKKRGWADEEILTLSGNDRMERKRLDSEKARSRNCECCGTVFTPRQVQINAGHGKFCSQRCNGNSKKNNRHS